MPTMTCKICTYGASTRELRQGSLGLRSSHCRLRGQVSTVGKFKGVFLVCLVVLKAVIEAFHLEGLGVSCRHTQHRLPWQPRIPWGMEQLQFLPSLRQMVEWRREDTQRCTDCTACKGLEPDESAGVGLRFLYLDVPEIITPPSKLFSTWTLGCHHRQGESLEHLNHSRTFDSFRLPSAQCASTCTTGLRPTE
jgi:hypothetical protein